MTREDVIRMAREQGDFIDDKRGGAFIFNGDPEHTFNIFKFAALVAAAERLAAKKDIEEEMTDEIDDQAYHLCMQLIAKILKRGQT